MMIESTGNICHDTTGMKSVKIWTMGNLVEQINFTHTHERELEVKPSIKGNLRALSIKTKMWILFYADWTHKPVKKYLWHGNIKKLMLIF